MKLTLNWLKEFVDIDLDTKELVELLDFSGTKVESVNTPGKHLSGIVVAEVLNIEKHPNADALVLVDVRSDGGEQRVVCGAQNFSVGDRVPLAQVGARLEGMEITERRIRGEVSRGMLCSGAELGVSRDHSGILVLPPDTELGADVVPALGLDDTLFELEITLNRPDCMSVVGVAREIAALTGQKLRRPEVGLDVASDLSSPVSVRIEDPEACPRYLARYIEGLEIGPSPHWLATRLLACGVRPISNVVDVTNYVLLELGHPLHAFAGDRVAESSIAVRRAKAGERFTTLDGIERELHPDDLLIAHGAGPIALAGVMGGEESEVSESTTRVILESAYFDPATIAFTARRQNLRTEASARFERGMDVEMVPFAAERAAQLLGELAGGRVSATVTDEYPKRIERARVRLRPPRTDKLLGITISPSEQAERLRSIEMEVSDAAGTFDVLVPTFRPDITREVDLIEEVARLHGFQELPSTLPKGAAGGLERNQRAERKLRAVLADLGVYEAVTPSLISPEDVDRLGLDESNPTRRMVEVANPMVEDERAMRTTLLPSLLKAVALNRAQRAEGVALFEVARIYEPTDDPLPQEGLVLAAAFSGLRRAQEWSGPARRWDFFGVKGVLEATFEGLGLDALGFVPAKGMPFHPTRAATVSLRTVPLGALGELHPDVCERFDVAEHTLVFELSLAPVFEALPERVQLQEPSRYPGTYLDLAVVVDEAVAASEVRDVIARAGAPEVVSVRLFDVYRGEQVEAGKKSLAFALELRSEGRTMTDDEALKVRDRILPALQERTGGSIRA
ncbi:MAG: phenylalanine--tRNA ligase subunit beta [Actinomycetota bacterium]